MGASTFKTLSNFISAYQKINYLTLGELWAVPIMLRLALLENLSHLPARIAVDRNDASLVIDGLILFIREAEENPEGINSGPRRYGTGKTSDGQRIRRRTHPKTSMEGSRPYVTNYMDRTTSFRIRNQHQLIGACRKSKAGSRSGVNEQ